MLEARKFAPDAGDDFSAQSNPMGDLGEGGSKHLDAGLDRGLQDRNDSGAVGDLEGRRDAARAGDVGVPALKLLAGNLGGCGSFDGTGTTARFRDPRGMAADGAGNLFVADSGNHTIRRVVLATGAVTTFVGASEDPGTADGAAGAARFNLPTGVATDGAGNLFVADSGNHTIRRVVLATGTVTTLAGSPGELGGTDGERTAARFNTPLDVASDGQGSLFVADSKNNRIRKVVVATGFVTTLAGSGDGGSADGTGAAARFDSPTSVASDGVGSLFVTEGHRVRKVALMTGEVTTLAGGTSRYSVDGIGSKAGFDYPYGMVSAGARNLFVADRYSIRKVLIETGAVTTLTGDSKRPGWEDGTGAEARFANPAGMVSDGVGNLLVADRSNCTIRKVVIATAAVTTLAGSPGRPGQDDGTGSGAYFHVPWGVASDRAGNLFIADSVNVSVRKVVAATGAVTTLVPFIGHVGMLGINPLKGVAIDDVGNLFVADPGDEALLAVSTDSERTLVYLPRGEIWDSPRDVIGPGARFNRPAAVATGGAGNVYVTDSGNHTILHLTGSFSYYRPADPPLKQGLQISALAGLEGQSGSTDGTGANARFDSPAGVVSDGAGNLFVADSGNYTIRKVVIATGIVSTLAGSPGNSGSADGTGSTARFSTLGEMAMNSAGDLFVVDTGNHTIRKIAVATRVVTTVVGSPGKAMVIPGPLPASLNSPRGLAFGSTGELYITDENAVLVARF